MATTQTINKSKMLKNRVMSSRLLSHNEVRDILNKIDDAFNNDDFDSLIETLADYEAEVCKYRNAVEFFAVMSELR